jgi:AcrR family transcriptional regulator
MRLTATARRERILEAAQRLFARRGFQGTTTRAIAERAGITEAMIFRHFRSKESLYWAVLTELCRSRGAQQRLRGILDGRAPDEAVFAALAEDILRRNEDPAMTRLLLYSALENHKLSHRFFRSHIFGYYELLAEHIRRRMKAGEFRQTDPMLAARGFLGMVAYHLMVQELFGGKRMKDYDPGEVSRTLAEIWLAGMRKPDGNGSHGPGNGNGSKNGKHRVRDIS